MAVDQIGATLRTCSIRMCRFRPWWAGIAAAVTDRIAGSRIVWDHLVIADRDAANHCQ